MVRRKRIWFHGPKILPWGHSPGLNGFVGWTIRRRKIMGNGEKEKWSCSTKHPTGPESKRG